MRILGIESSCDETAAAVVQVESNQYQLLSNIVSSQVKLHERYGGVVPELASRAHLKKCLPVVQEALNEANTTPEEIDYIAVTAGPGLVGALLVGVQTAKSLAYIWEKPFLGVHHLEGHLEAVFLEKPPHPSFPFLALLVSGGHTELSIVHEPLVYTKLGATRDDAAGEAFDKGAKMLGLSYPGGVAIDNLAKHGRRDWHPFPRAMRKKGLDFSFSGLKTACRVKLEEMKQPLSQEEMSDFCASYQEAIVEILWLKTKKAMEEHQLRELVVTGGVAANSRLRELFQEKCKQEGWSVFLPSRKLCTDNAAMIAVAAARRIHKQMFSDFSLNPSNRLAMGTMF